MIEEREVLLIGGPLDGKPVRYRSDLLEQTGFDPEDLVNMHRTEVHNGRYVRRRYVHPVVGVVELFVWAAWEDDDE